MHPIEARIPIRLAAAAAGVHFVTLLSATFSAFGREMGRFDTGRDGNWLDAILQSAAAVLGLPLLPVLQAMPARYFPGITGYIPIVANSMLWGIGVALLWRRPGPGRGAA